MMYAIAFFISCLAACVSSQPYNYDHPTANLSTSWINAFNSSKLEMPLFNSSDDYTLRPILIRALPREHEWTTESTPSYACGFYCSGLGCSSYLFSISIVEIYYQYGPYFNNVPQVVWSANRNNLVGENATVELTNGGDLLLRDADGTLVWSTGTDGKAVAGLNLTEMGNLVLSDANNSMVWKSFDHPTDCLLVGQILPTGKNLTAAASPSNWSAGLYSVSMGKRGLVASMLSHPPQVYSQITFPLFTPPMEHSYAEFRKGSLVLYANVSGGHYVNRTILTRSSTTQYIKLEPDGHLRVYEWVTSWTPIHDILKGDLGECAFPRVCGEYGICTDGQCRCPEPSFRPRDSSHADRGCSEVVPLDCNASDNYRLLKINDVTYFTFAAAFAAEEDLVFNPTDLNSCKEECLKNCSCKAAMFFYGPNTSVGFCYLPTEIFSLMNNEKHLRYYNSSVSIKIQTPASVAAKGRPRLLGRILGSTLGVFLVFVLFGVTLFVHRRRKRKTDRDVEIPVMEEDYLDHVPGMPTRFSFEELAAATDDFSNKLGEGGFGSVYEGSFNDGTRIAVKRLDGVGHIKKSFLAEVESIGSIHHINLVRLIGFCAEKFHRLLVYEYMCNGSLEKWIYSTSQERSLDWSKRRKIVLDVAKGLAYLHEDCRQKILHLDIKPQNILLDEHYNAKLADFGLSKLIDRNQSQVVTTMRGTPGYLAPEWLNAIITEKLDVYSFGVVVLEMLTGRKIFEQSRPEEERHLLTVFKKKAEEGQWLDLVDKCYQDKDCDLEEVEKMMQMSAWCLQSEHEMRPSMSMVVKVMEGAKDVPQDIDCNLLIPRYLSGKTSETSSSKDVTPLLPSLLSAPR